MAPPTQSFAKEVKRKTNWLFLRRLYRLPEGATKPRRLKVLNTGSKKQREILIQLLHHAVTGEMPIKFSHFKIITKSGKREFLEKHFFHPEDVNTLLSASDKRQKEILAQVTNFHLILHHVFHQHHDS